MKKCVLFATHIPNSNKLFVGKEFLDKFVESFNEYDIYIGINNSCQEWINMVEDYKDKLNIFYEITPTELLDTSAGAAWQTTLRMLKNNGKKYDIYWFGHTKGATSNSHKFRQEVTEVFWDKKDIVEDKILNENFSMYSPWVGVTVENYLNTTLPIFVKGKPNDDLTSYYSFWVHNGEVINKFIENCIPEFFTKNLLSFERLEDDEVKKNKWGRNVDRYFFERDFPMIYQVVCDNPKLLYSFVHIYPPGPMKPSLRNSLNKPNNIKI